MRPKVVVSVVFVAPAELRGIRQVEDFEADLRGLAPGKRESLVDTDPRSSGTGSARRMVRGELPYGPAPGIGERGGRTIARLDVGRVDRRCRCPNVRVTNQVRPLPSAEETQIRIRGAGLRTAFKGRRSRARRWPRAFQPPSSHVAMPSARGTGNPDNRRQDDPVRRVEDARRRTRHPGRSCSAALPCGRVHVALAELVVLRAAERVAQTAAPPPVTSAFPARWIIAWYCRFPPSVDLVQVDVAELRERSQQLAARNRRAAAELACDGDAEERVRDDS